LDALGEADLHKLRLVYMRDDGFVANPADEHQAKLGSRNFGSANFECANIDRSCFVSFYADYYGCLGLDSPKWMNLFHFFFAHLVR
jgi:hypothetical protein